MRRVNVRGAGLKAVNGTYKPKGRTFVKGIYSILRASVPPMNTSKDCWILACQPNADADAFHLYASPDSSKNPPTKTWEVIGGLAPSPSLDIENGQGSSNGPSDEKKESKEFEENFDLVRSIGEECQTEGELRALLKKKPKTFRLYDGFEPSGRMHIAQGIFKAINVNKATKAGGTFVFWIADWFALMNDKMGGDLEKIKVVGEYFIEVWKAAGMDLERVQFKWCSDEICGKKAEEYWTQMLDVARVLTFARVTKCCQIMGRLENKLTAAQILYPVMQCTDIFFLRADICQLGVDQRKVNIRAREYCTAANRKQKPIILSHHMLYGLGAGQAKMSKSNPDSAVFMEDSPEDVHRKIMKAYCPRTLVDKTVEDDNSMSLVKDELKNPCLDYIRYIVMGAPGSTFTVGGVTYTNPDQVKEAFVDSKISEADLKQGLVESVNALIDPVRKHFLNDPKAKELLAKVQEYKKLKKPAVATKRRSCVLNDLGEVHAVIAPIPTAHFKLATVLEIVRALEAGAEETTRVLWCPDWSAYTLNSTYGDHRPIKAFYYLLETAIKSLAPDLKFLVIFQSETILKDPSNYWISVIHVGRTYLVQDLQKAVGEPFTQASEVLAALMYIGDLITLNAISLVPSGKSEEGIVELASKYIQSSGSERVPAMIPYTSLEQLQLHAEGLIDKINVLLIDPDNQVKPKIKKSYCNADDRLDSFNPVLAWVKELFKLNQGVFVIKRKPQNGGNKEYTSLEDLIADFSSGVLHPGDLKPALGNSLCGLLDGFRKNLKSSKEAQTAERQFKQFVKKSKKK